MADGATPHGRINAEIECLRAIAVGMAIFSHINPLVPGGSGIWKILNGYVTGWTGVDLFFCISGFVISKSLVDSLEANRQRGRWHIAAQAFWVRRFFRIAPSAWLWVAVPLVCSIAFNRSGVFWTFDVNVRSTAAVMLNLANFVGPQNLGPNPVYWSLSLEEQFYVAYPVFLLLTPLAWRWRALLALIALQAIPDRSALFHSMMWLTRLDAIMWGCLVFMFSRTVHYREWEPSFCASRPVALATSTLLIALLCIVPAMLAPTLKVVSVVGVLSAALIFLASFDRGYALPLRGPAKAVLLWIGARSFALYLVHIPAISLTQEIWFRINQARHLPPPDHSYGAVMVLTWCVLAFGLADLNYRLIETPLRRRGAKIAQRMLAASDDRTSEIAPRALASVR